MFLEGRRPTWAESNLDALIANLRAIRAYIRKTRNVKYLLPVKADAYGHGIIGTAETAIAEGVDYLGIAVTDEGMTLRDAGITAPLLILGLSFRDQIETLIDYNLTPTVADRAFVDALDDAARKRKKRVNVHVKVDTGMGRIGVAEEDALPFIEYVAGKKNLFLEGVFTHFPVADDDVAYSREQIARFTRIVNALDEKALRPPIVHAANSGGVVNLPESYFDMVRPGLISYGYYPCEGMAHPIKLTPMLRLKTRVVFVKRIAKGASVSYGRTFIAKRPCFVATIPIGYEDGLTRRFSNNMEMLLRGKRVPLIGRVTMDQCMLDVTRFYDEGDAPITAGEEVVIIGEQQGERIPIEELCRRIGTIPYEITCMIGDRVPLVYCKNNE